MHTQTRKSTENQKRKKNRVKELETGINDTHAHRKKNDREAVTAGG